MTDEIKVLLKEAGIDYNSAIERFMGNEALFFKFLFRFCDDTTFQQMTKAIEAKDCKKAFELAHTLKGVCGNLSLERLGQVISAQVEYLRKEQITQAQELMTRAQKEYDRIMDVLNFVQK